MKKKWNVHFCTPWNDCMMSGFRINVRTPWYFIIAALNPAAKICSYVNKPCKWIDVEKL